MLLAAPPSAEVARYGHLRHSAAGASVMKRGRSRSITSAAPPSIRLVALFESLDTAAGTRIDILNVLCGAQCGATKGIFIMRIATVDNGITPRQQRMT